jgi:hypothetical protein
MILPISTQFLFSLYCTFMQDDIYRFYTIIHNYYINRRYYVERAGHSPIHHSEEGGFQSWSFCKSNISPHFWNSFDKPRLQL